MIQVVYYMKEGPTRDWFTTPCFKVTYCILSVGFSAVQIYLIHNEKENMYEHIVFSTFVRLDLLIHCFSYANMFLEYMTYD